MKVDLNEKLINTSYNTEKICEKKPPAMTNTYCDTLLIRSKIFLLNFVYYFFSNFSSNIIIFFINKKYTESTKYIDVIGASQSFMNFSIYPILLGCSSVIEVIGTQSYGAKKYKLLGYYLYRARIIGIAGLVIISIFLVFCNNYIFNFFGFDEISQKMLRNILCLRIFGSFFDLEYFILLRFLQIINKGHIGLILILISSFSLILYSYLFISVLSLESFGVGMISLSYSLTNVLLMWFYVLMFKPLEKAIFFIRKKSIIGLMQVIKLTIPLIFSSFLDNIKFEFMTIFFSSKKEFALYIIA